MRAGIAFEVLAKVGMGDRDHCFGPFGRWPPLEVDDPELGHDVIMSLRGAVAILPGVRLNTTRLLRTPSRFGIAPIAI